MPKPYSNDLRLKLVEAYQRNEHTQAELQELFGVSRGFVEGVLRRFRQTGSYEHKPHGGGMPAKLDEQGLARLAALSDAYPDATLEELCELYEKQHSLHLPRSVLHRGLHTLGITRKKSLVRPRRRSAPTSRSSGSSTKTKSNESSGEGSSSSTRRG